MKEYSDIFVPDREEFVRGYRLYNEKECRGPIWFNALAIVQHHWGDSRLMSEGVGIIIKGWNRFYSGFDPDALTTSIEANLSTLSVLRTRDINSYIRDDEKILLPLFNIFQEALKRTSDNRISPVSARKALSLFAPSFFHIWDSNIAFAYHCTYAFRGGKEYLSFMDRMKFLAEHVGNYVPKNDDRSILKRIDEYNYSKYTMHWV